MKTALTFAVAASLAAGAVAQPHNHQHRHQHARKHEHAALLNERDQVINYKYVEETSYVDVNGNVISAEAAEAGLADGEYSIVGETTPTSTALATTLTPTTTAVPSTSAAPTTSSASGGEFLELKLGSIGSSTAEASSASATATASASSSSSSSGATGVDADFPDGTIDCATFPSAYGAVAVDQTGVSPWVGYMDVGTSNYVLGQTDDITVDISEPTSGDPQPGYFVGYHCPAGYDQAQWPAAQGSSGQSIGGLYCGSDNKLHLTRTDSTKLCQKGAGNVQIVSKLSKSVFICKTWYPGNEGMYLPTEVSAGATVSLFNPLQSESYEWEGSTTSAQYYMNLQGLTAAQACVWDSPSPYTKKAGNWAGVNLGTSENSDGETFLSIFHNTPTSDAALDYNIVISGSDVSGLPCKYTYSDNEFTGDGNGCTVSSQPLAPGASAGQVSNIESRSQPLVARSPSRCPTKRTPDDKCSRCIFLCLASFFLST